MFQGFVQLSLKVIWSLRKKLLVVSYYNDEGQSNNLGTNEKLAGISVVIDYWLICA